MYDKDGAQPRDAVTQLPLSEILRQGGISESVIHRIQGADIDKDGNLDVGEIVRLVQEGHRAQADRKLFRNLVVALAIGMLVSIAAFCGTIYAIVKLTEEVEDKDGVLVSSNTGEVLTTGQVMVTLNVTNLYDKGPLGVRQLESLVVPSLDGTGFRLHRVASVSVVPGKTATITSLDGRKIVIDREGGFYYEDGSLTGNATAARRRLLGEIQTDGIRGIGRKTHVEYAAICKSQCTSGFPVNLFAARYRTECEEKCKETIPQPEWMNDPDWNPEYINDLWNTLNYGICLPACETYYQYSWGDLSEDEKAKCIQNCLRDNLWW